MLFLSAILCGSAGLTGEAQSAGRAGDTAGLEADFTVIGEYDGAYNGGSIAVGDVNGDGLDDLVYGVPLASPNNLAGAGEVHIFFAERTRKGLAVQKIKSVSSLPDVIIGGESPGHRLGTAVAVGDLNGDGINDVIMGGGGYTVTGRSTCGGVFVVFGRRTWPAFYNLQAQRADVQVIGAHHTDHLGGHKTHTPATYTGQSVAAGDINGDGIDDLICGAPDATFTLNQVERVHAGAVYVLWGRSNWSAPHQRDLTTTAADLTIYSRQTKARLGGCVRTGDFNGDRLTDLVVGADEEDAPGRAAAGFTHVFWGRRSWPGTVLDLGGTGKADVTIMGERQWDQTGYSFDLGDFNNDQIDDLIVGGWRYDAIQSTRQNSGRVHVFYGKKGRTPNEVIDLGSTLGDLNFLGAGSENWLGYRVAAGDVDGDGIDDMVMSAPGAASSMRTRAGITYVFRGGQFRPPFYTIDLQFIGVDWRLSGPAAEIGLGQSLGLGDINGDRVADVVQGGDLTNFGGTPTFRAVGRVVATYGGPLFLTSPAKVGSTMTMKILSPADANQIYVCATSFGSGGNAGIPLPGAGVVPIDLEPITVLSVMNLPPFLGFSGGLDSNGISTAPAVALPNAPALVGISLFYAMIVIKNPIRIGNRVHTTIGP